MLQKNFVKATEKWAKSNLNENADTSEKNNKNSK